MAWAIILHVSYIDWVFHFEPRKKTEKGRKRKKRVGQKNVINLKAGIGKSVLDWWFKVIERL